MEKDETSRYNLYFIVRSVITASMGFFTFSLVALILGNLSGIQAVVLSFVSFAYPVLLTKIFHKGIQSVVETILIYSAKHERIERLIIKILK